jgi:hypothetical protein
LDPRFHPGFALRLQVFANLMTPSSPPRLPAIFQAESAHGVIPSEPCSSRAAVRRLRRLCPLVVGYERCQRTSHPSSTQPKLHDRRMREEPPLPPARRLQGFAPHENPPPQCSGLDYTAARSSHGFLPSRVTTLTAPEQPSLSHPLMRLPHTTRPCRNRTPS